ncbi:MAG: YifB family Mg chelatase-like AAA ATPase [Paludibacteraceae bacterium]|nr:YifB family Mg chelatase-like AAA ATPase [Paludibacteraceae bacterium]
MLIKIYSAAPVGIDAVPVTIEVHSVPGFEFTLVGLPDVAVKESHERILAALTVNGYDSLRRSFTINMAPADIKKEGAAYDLPLAIGMLAGGEKVKTKMLEQYMLIGELSLDGSLQPVRGALPIALCARKEGYKGLVLPAANAEEAAVVDGLEVYGMETLSDVVRFLNGEKKNELDPEDVYAPTRVDTQALFDTLAFPSDLDFSDVRGQYKVRRAVEIAAAGGHNMIMVGPPGAGKSMIAKRIPSILPPLTLEEALETTKIHSVAGLMNKRKGVNSSLIVQRPFRSPHHTITDVALVGGGANPHPGEISLAHNGVLFLDELPEYKRSVLEVLRQPLEDRHITVARTKETVDYPASFMLVAAMNPCPCGHYGENNPAHPCTCTPAQVHRYLSKISGPLLDRIDIQCEIEAVPYEQLRDTQPGESSAAMRERVLGAREIQNERFRQSKTVHCNAMMSTKMVRQYCALDAESDKLLEFSMNKLGLSARAYDRILKVARTIADLEGSMNIGKQHLLEAISYRSLDRNMME